VALLWGEQRDSGGAKTRNVSCTVFEGPRRSSIHSPPRSFLISSKSLDIMIDQWLDLEAEEGNGCVDKMRVSRPRARGRSNKSSWSRSSTIQICPVSPHALTVVARSKRSSLQIFRPEYQLSQQEVTRVHWQDRQHFCSSRISTPPCPCSAAPPPLCARVKAACLAIAFISRKKNVLR